MSYFSFFNVVLLVIVNKSKVVNMYVEYSHIHPTHTHIEIRSNSVYKERIGGGVSSIS